MTIPAADIETGKQEDNSSNEPSINIEDKSNVRTSDSEDDENAEGSDTIVALNDDDENAPTYSSNRMFPASFYDSKTGMLMVNPVVDANGDSCERPLNMADEDDDTADGKSNKEYYPNRALRSIIQRETQRNMNSIVGSLRRLDDSARKTWNQMVDKSALATTDYRPLPDSFYCPITQDLMVDPVIAPDGNTFEREAIVNWIRANGTNPVTRQALTIGALRRNNNLYALIQAEKNRPNISDRHPSIRRWVESNADDATSRRTLNPEDLIEPVHNNNNNGSYPSNTPINYAQIAEARRRRTQNDRSWTLLFLFTLIVILLFVPSNLTFFVLFVSMAMLTCCKSAQERRLIERQREEAATPAAAGTTTATETQ